MSQIPKDIDYPHKNAQHLPRARAPIHEIPQKASRDRAPKPAAVPAQAVPKPNGRKSSTKEKHHAQRQNQNPRRKTQPKPGAPQQAQVQASSYRKPHVDDEEGDQETGPKIQQSLLNNQGIPFRAIQPVTKDRLLSQGKDPETNPRHAQKGKAKAKENSCTPIQPDLDPADSKSGIMATIKERPEPKEVDSLRQSRKQPQSQPTLRPSPERRPKIVVPNHNNLEDIKTRTAATKHVQNPIPKDNSVPHSQYQYRCSICKITVSRGTMSAFKGTCPACLNLACLHAVMEGGRGKSGGEGRKGRGDGKEVGGKMVGGGERKMGGDGGRKERREREKRERERG